MSEGELTKRLISLLSYLSKQGVFSFRLYNDGALVTQQQVENLIDEVRKEFLSVDTEYVIHEEYYKWFKKWFGSEEATQK